MGYKILGAGIHVPANTVLHTGTARDALKKLQDMKNRCRSDKGIQIYANGVVISEEDLNRRAHDE
jgi:hypothetical protein